MLVHLLLEECAQSGAIGNFCFNYKFKNFTISSSKRLNNKSFYHILLLISRDIDLNLGPKIIFNHWIQVNGMLLDQKDST